MNSSTTYHSAVSHVERQRFHMGSMARAHELPSRGTHFLRIAQILSVERSRFGTVMRRTADSTEDARAQEELVRQNPDEFERLRLDQKARRYELATRVY